MAGTELELLEKFAGPLATVIAAITAAGVTFFFNRAQIRFARSQAETAEAQRQIARAQLEIAYDKLKHDLFEKRYEVFIAAQELIWYALDPSSRLFVDPEAQRLSLKLAEATFFFPPDTVDFCNRIQETVFGMKGLEPELFSDGSPSPVIPRVRDLQELRGELIERFARDLALEQMTDKVAVDETYEIPKHGWVIRNQIWQRNKIWQRSQ
jgi:hypothetical protein